METMEKKIKEAFKKYECYYDWDVSPDGTAEIHVEWGDWKHDHLFVDYIMKEQGFYLTDEAVTEEDGSDAYSSIHKYIYLGA